MTSEEANNIVRTKLEALSVAIEDCSSSNFQKKNRVVSIANFVEDASDQISAWQSQLKGLQKRYGKFLLQIKTFAVQAGVVSGAAAVQSRDVMYESIQSDLRDMLKTLKNVVKPVDLISMEDTIKATKEMMDSIVYNAGLAAAEKKELKEHLEMQDSLWKRAHQAATSRTTAAQELNNLTTEIGEITDSYDRRLTLLREEMSTAKLLKDQVGAGCWYMDGSPKSPRSKEIHAAWKSGDFPKVKSLTGSFYQSNGFKVEFRTKLIRNQQEAKDRVEELEDRLKALEQQQREEMDGKRERKAVLSEEVRKLEEVESKARKDYQDCAAKVTKGLDMLPPVQKAHMVEIQRVSEAIRQTAETYEPCRKELVEFKSTLVQLQNCLEERECVSYVLELVTRLQFLANDPQGPTFLLTQLGATHLNAIMMPRVDPGKAGMLTAPADEDVLRLQLMPQVVEEADWRRIASGFWNAFSFHVTVSWQWAISREFWASSFTLPCSWCANTVLCSQ